MVKSDFPQLGSKQARQELEVTSHGQESKEKTWQEAWPGGRAVRKDVDAMEESHTEDFYYMALCGCHPHAGFVCSRQRSVEIKS